MKKKKSKINKMNKNKNQIKMKNRIINSKIIN